VRRAPDVDEKVKVSCFLFVTGRQRSHVGTAFIQWRYIAPINVKFGAAENVPHFTFTMFNVQRSQFFFILAINLSIRGDSFAQFFTKFSAFVRFYR